MKLFKVLSLSFLLLSLNSNAFFGAIKDKYVESYGSISEKVERDLLHPSTACIELGNQRGFDTSEELIDNCNSIETKIAYKCVETLFSYSTIYPTAIRPCSGFTNDLALSALRTYRNKYAAPKSLTIIVLGSITSEKEKVCVENKLKYANSTVKITDIEVSCIEKTPEELDDREYEIQGYLLSPRSVKKEVEYGAKSFGDFLKEKFLEIF